MYFLLQVGNLMIDLLPYLTIETIFKFCLSSKLLVNSTVIWEWKLASSQRELT